MGVIRGSHNTEWDDGTRRTRCLGPDEREIMNHHVRQRLRVVNDGENVVTTPDEYALIRTGGFADARRSNCVILDAGARAIVVHKVTTLVCHKGATLVIDRVLPDKSGWGFASTLKGKMVFGNMPLVEILAVPRESKP